MSRRYAQGAVGLLALLSACVGDYDAFPFPEAALGPVQGLASGQFHTLADDGETLFAWGDDGAAQLDGTSHEALALPGAVPLPERPVAYGGGMAHSCALLRGGAVYCWGANDVGQLGQGDLLPHSGPVRVVLPEPAVHLVVGFDSNCVVAASGQMSCWGANLEHQIALDSETDMPPPVLVATLVPDLSDVAHLTLGQGHGCAVRRDGSLWCWGRNVNQAIDASATGQYFSPVQKGDGTNWAAVACGQEHTCGITRDKKLYCWGENDFGQLGLGTTGGMSEGQVDGSFDAVSAGLFVTGAIRNGRLYTWGRNFDGELGLGGGNDKNVPTQVGSDSDWAQVSVGRFHACAQKDDGALFCWGKNEFGELGAGDLDGHSTPTLVLHR